jgi:hypothetical protein
MTDMTNTLMTSGTDGTQTNSVSVMERPRCSKNSIDSTHSDDNYGRFVWFFYARITWYSFNLRRGDSGSPVQRTFSKAAGFPLDGYKTWAP